MLKWKPPREYRSLTYNQSGFKLTNTSGRPTLWLSKIGEIPIHLHRDVPENATVKQVTVKREPTGEWYATFGIDMNEATREKPANPEKCVGIDVGILNYAHDTDGTAVGSLDLSDERERLEDAQRDLSRKERGSANWEKQRQVVAERHAELKRKRRDFLHKLSNYYATEYDLVAVEDLDVKGLVELPGNSRNRAGAAWGTFPRFARRGRFCVCSCPAGPSNFTGNLLLILPAGTTYRYSAPRSAEILHGRTAGSISDRFREIQELCRRRSTATLNARRIRHESSLESLPARIHVRRVTWSPEDQSLVEYATSQGVPRCAPGHASRTVQ